MGGSPGRWARGSPGRWARGSPGRWARGPPGSGAGLESVVTRRSSEGERTFGSRGWWGAGSRRRTRVGCTPWRPRRRAWTMRRPARGREEGRVSRQDAGEGRGIRGECERVPVSRARVPKKWEVGAGKDARRGEKARTGRMCGMVSPRKDDLAVSLIVCVASIVRAERRCPVGNARRADESRSDKRRHDGTSARNGSTNGKIVIGPILAPTSSGGSRSPPASGETRATRARDTGPRAEGASPKRASAKLEGHHVGAPPAMASRGCRGRPQGGVVRGGARSIPFPAPQA